MHRPRPPRSAPGVNPGAQRVRGLWARVPGVGSGTYNRVGAVEVLAMSLAQTLGELKRTYSPQGGVKDELRRNLLRKLAAGEPLFPGVLAYEDTVMPQVVNAV